MTRRLIVINAVLVGIALTAVALIVREARAPAPTPVRRGAPPAQATAPPPTPAPQAPGGGYGVVASRNLFSPNRSEAPASPTASAPPVPKPNLYGIILREGAPVAYLEDPTTKRVAGYRLGDAVAGGTLKSIGNDHVVLNRPEGEVNVRLRDPAEPRPAAPPTAAGAPGGPPVAGAQPMPPAGVIPPGVSGMPPQAGQQPQPSVLPPGQPPVLPRRPLPPNLLRRLPPAATDAPAQN